MKLAYIAPINALNKISALGDIEFCLAPYTLRNEKYKQYFINAKKKGRYIIMDNGVAENDLIDNNNMVNLAIEMKIDEIIIPDEIGNLEKTKEMREEFLEKYYYKLKKYNIKLMSVIQGKDLNEYCEDLYNLIKNKFIDVIGIPFRMNYAKYVNFDTKGANHSINRFNFISLQKNKLEYYNNKEIHLLGCNLPIEIFSYNKFSFIRSMDSKLMARYGLNEQIYKKTDINKPEKKLYITDELNKKQINIAIKNIKKVKNEINRSL